MYDCATGKREIAFDNIERILGMDAGQFETLADFANNIVSLMGGFLKLESKKGEESTFNATIAFRYHSAAKRLEETERVVNQPVDFSGMRVLLAEDNVHLSFLCILRRTILP